MSDESRIGRRGFLRLGALASVSTAAGGSLLARRGADDGRLKSRPHKATKTIAPGDHVLSDENGRRSILYVPPTYDPTKPTPFLVAFHGASGNGESMLRSTRPPAEKHGVIVLSPSSREGTWDGIRGGFGVDSARVDTMLDQVFDQCNVDQRHLGVLGFSDGASYAISTGIINGDVFTHIICHSGGFIIPGQAHGRPKVYLSHGRQDTVLPIDKCGRYIAAQLTRQAYVLRFDEFDGGHTASPEIREAAMSWFLASEV